MKFPHYVAMLNPAKALELPIGNGRLIPMEGLRGFAVMLVFIQHYFTFCAPFVVNTDFLAILGDRLRVYGNLGVDLFFILSGYLIYGGLLRRQQRFWKFMQRRFERLYPAFLTVVVPLVLIHLYFDTQKIPEGFVAGSWYVGLNLLMLPGLLPIEPLHGVAWSLSYEMFFYIVLGLGVGSANAATWSPQLRISLILSVALMLCGLTAVIGAGGPFIKNWGVPIRMIAFLSGMVLIEIEGLRVTFPTVWIVVGLWACAALLQSTVVMPLYIGFPLHAAVFGLVCGKCFQNRNRLGDIFSWWPLRWLGNMSYSYYLVHGPIVMAFFSICSALGIKVASSWTLWVIMPLVFGITLLPAFLLFVSVERPLSLVPSRHIRRTPA